VILTGGTPDSPPDGADPALDGEPGDPHGRHGMAAHMKLIINQIMGTILCVFSEGALTGWSGASRREDLAVLQNSVVACPAIQLKGPDMLGSGLHPELPAEARAQDMRLAVEAGKRRGSRRRDESRVRPVRGGADKGFGDRDISAVVHA